VAAPGSIRGGADWVVDGGTVRGRDRLTPFPHRTLAKAQRSTVQACRLEGTAAARSGLAADRSRHRGDHGDRMMIVTAALSVVGLTALRVTSTDYPA
jgi:hypothetical protein